MKTICIDLRPLQIGHEKRGIGMYIKSLLENLPNDGNRYIFYAFDKNDPIKELNIDFANEYSLVQTKTIKTSLNKPSDTFGLVKLINHRFWKIKRFKPDVFIQFDFMLGIPKWRSIKTIVIAYDLIPLIMQNDYLPAPDYALQHAVGKRAKLRAVLRSLYYWFKYKLCYRVFKRASKIISISEATRQDFIRLLNIKPKHIVTIPLAPVLSHAEPDYTLANKIKKPFIFYIGGTDYRKRIKDLVKTFHVARSRGADFALVLAGNEFRDAKKIPDIEGRTAILTSPYKKDIHLAGFINDAEKMGFYYNAHCFLFCSAYEGFGLPILEAMHASCPVVSYSNSSIPEAAGRAGIMVDTGDFVGAAKAILTLQDPAIRNEQIALGQKQVKKFSWDKYTATFLEQIF